MSWKDTVIKVLAKRLDYVEKSFANERTYLEDNIATLKSQLINQANAVKLIEDLYFMLNNIQDSNPDPVEGINSRLMQTTHDFILDQNRARTTGHGRRTA